VWDSDAATPPVDSSYHLAMSATRIFLALTVSLLVNVAAVAQQAADIPPVKPDKPWIAVVIAIVLLFCVGAVSVMTPKRTHQD